MDEKLYIQKLLEAKGFTIDRHNKHMLDNFIAAPENIAAAATILEQQQYIMSQWEINNKIAAITSLHIQVPNAKVGKAYSAVLDLKRLGLDELALCEWQGLEALGLSYNPETATIEGIPVQSGDLKFQLHFKVKGEAEHTAPHIKDIILVVNADPKTLWKDIASDSNAPFWKVDDDKAQAPLGDKHIVVASNRGRSHENTGAFRDDDFAFEPLANGWSVVAVSDGAGSYSLSRRGAQLACQAIVSFFEQQSDPEQMAVLEEKINQYGASKEEALWKEIEVEAKQKLYKAVVHAHNTIKQEAEATQQSHPELFNNPKAKSLMDYYHATLIFALFKKFDFGYIIMSFGVGDCPVAVMNKDKTETKLLNILDVGEFGGGTRFLTQADIFQPDARPLTMAERFSILAIEDFSYLFLMTDGIYDAKFVVEANLEKHDKWLEFVSDLEGNNEDRQKVDLSAENPNAATELAAWMDFWSPGNHDDRTLAIIF